MNGENEEILPVNVRELSNIILNTIGSIYFVFTLQDYLIVLL